MPRRKKAPRKLETPWNPLEGQNTMGWDEWQQRHSGAGGDAMRKKYEENALGPGAANYRSGASLDQIKENIRHGRTQVYPRLGADFISSRESKGGNLAKLLDGVPPDKPVPSLPGIKVNPDDAALAVGDRFKNRERDDLAGPDMPLSNTRAPGQKPFNPSTGREEDYKGFLKRTDQGSSALAAGRFLKGTGGKLTPKMKRAMDAAAFIAALQRGSKSKPKKKEGPRRER